MTNQPRYSKGVQQMLDQMRAGAQLVISTDAMGRSSYALQLPDGSRQPIVKVVGWQTPFPLMTQVSKQYGRQVWSLR